jgi:hypothetical protein
MLVKMEWNKAFQRIWQTWKYAFVIAFLIYFFVFLRAYSYEVQREEESYELEEEIPLFQTTISPAISAGAKSYSVNIVNNQLYTIEELIVGFTGDNLKPMDDLSESYQDTVAAGSSINYENPVYPGAIGMDVYLFGQEFPLGGPDISLMLVNLATSENWISNINGNNHEEIHLTQADLSTSSLGDFRAVVTHEDGLLSVSYTLDFYVQYGPLESTKAISLPLGPGGATKLDFVVNIQESQVENIVVKVDANVVLPDKTTLDLQADYNSQWEIIRRYQPIPEQYSSAIPWGPVDLTGTSSVIMFTFTVIAGFAFYFHSRLKKIFMPRFIRRAHCFIALTSLMLVLAHMSTALQKAWPWGSIGMISAFSATSLLSVFVVFSFFDVEIIKTYGRRRWQVIHLLLTLAMAMFIILHFGFMGDHLGFLKGL